MNKKIILVIVAIALISVGVASLVGSVKIVPQPDPSWLILYNELDTAGDWKSALWINAAYGAVRTPITFTTIVMEEEDYNDAGQNLILLGGSKSLAIQAPWISLNPSWFNIAEPDVYTHIVFSVQNDGWHLQTPQNDYTLNAQNDVGIIIRCLDLTLRRWVIIAIGYSAWGTAYAAKLLVTDWSTVVSHSYIVFQVTQHGGSDPSSWTLEQFDGAILEQGIA